MFNDLSFYRLCLPKLLVQPKSVVASILSGFIWMQMVLVLSGLGRRVSCEEPEERGLEQRLARAAHASSGQVLPRVS
jgi:hypothetical protein